jgi:CIC family chloride channel protein
VWFSVIFTQLLLRMRAMFLRFPRNTAWFHPVAGGLLVGVIGWFVPQVLGVGYGYVGEALNGNMAFKVMLLLVVLKLLRVTASYASGNAVVSSDPPCSLEPRLGERLEQWRIISFPCSPRRPALMHWSVWVRFSPALCAPR